MENERNCNKLKKNRFKGVKLTPLSLKRLKNEDI